ncbi:MAG: hypothetical protein PHT69_16875 [Bacteroidales bacterium]|nr:hypothetical protein [Bacteroidales bacterium]
MENTLNNTGIIKVLIKWKWHLGIVLIVSVLLSSVFSGPKFIEPKFKSYAVVYPSNLIPYSTETETEQMLQIFRSDELRDSVIKIFDFANYYDINTSSDFYYTKMIRIYEKNIKIRKTEFESVIIEAYDRNPERACDMVKTIISLFNKKVRSLHKARAQEVLIIATGQLEQKSQQIDSIKNIINGISSDYNIIDFEAQAKEVTRGHLKTVDGSGASHVNSRAVEEMKEHLETKGNDYLLYKEVLAGLIEQYIELKTDYEIALRDVEKELTYTNVITSPVPADKKSFPIRWLIVFITTLSAMFLAVLAVVFIEKPNKL